MMRFVMAAVLLIVVVACSSEPPSTPITTTDVQVEALVDSPQAQADTATGGEKRRVKWPLVPGWDTVYGPDGYAAACFKQTRRDAIFLQLGSMVSIGAVRQAFGGLGASLSCTWEN